MQVIPVMDLLNQIVVHGKGGFRAEYKPVSSILVDSSCPLDIAKAFSSKLDLHTFYIADLNALQNMGNNYNVIKQLAKQGFKLWVDGGANRTSMVARLLEMGVEKVIVGTETLTQLTEVEKILQKYSPQVIISLDYRGGQLLTNCQELLRYSSLELINKFHSLGCKSFLSLNISAVGSNEGLAKKKQIPVNGICLHKEISFYYGGGVKELDDLFRLEREGYQGVLVATALHNGKITKGKLANFYI